MCRIMGTDRGNMQNYGHYFGQMWQRFTRYAKDLQRICKGYAKVTC